MKKIYLDYAAATPLHPEVFKGMLPYWQDRFYNPSAIYLSGKAVRHDIDEARAKIARILGARPAEVLFTSGATEANNLAISGVMEVFEGKKLVISSIEHESILAPAKKFKAKLAEVDKNGLTNLNHLDKLIDNQTVLVSVMLINNETGALQSISKVSELIASKLKSRQKSGNKLPLYLHSDAAQAPSFMDLHVSSLGVDMMTINGAKIYGPKQTGLLYIRAGVKLSPQIIGGNQELGNRSGTENVPGVIGLAKALEMAQANRQLEVKRLQALRQDFIKGINKIFHEAKIIGNSKHQAPHIVSVVFNGYDGERLMMELDELGIEVAVGSACSASSEEPSHVLKAIGLNDVEAKSTIRFSLGSPTKKAELEQTLKMLQKLKKT